MPRFEKARFLLPLAFLLPAIVALWMFGWFNHTVWCYSDMRAFLFPARDLAEGYLPVHYPLFDVLRDYDFERERWFYKYFLPGKGWRLVSYVGHGFPLLLAVVIRLFGLTAPFLFNTFLIGCLPLILYGIMRAAAPPGSGSREVRRIGILAGLMVLLIPLPVLNINLAPFRDISKYVGVLVSFLLLLLSGRKPFFAVPSGFLMGYAVWIKTDSLLMLIPILGWFIGSNGWNSRRARGGAVLLFVAGFAAGLLPSVWQNSHDRGDWLHFPQLNYLPVAARAGPIRQFSLHAIPLQLPEYVNQVVLAGLGLWSLLLLWSIFAGWKRWRGVLILFGLAAMVHIVAGSAGLRFWRRYQVGTFLSLLPLLAVGVDDLARRLSQFKRCDLAVYGCAAVLCLFQGRHYFLDRPDRSMTVIEARRLIRDLTPYLTPRAVIVCEDETRPTLDYLLSRMMLDRPHLSDARHDMQETLQRVAGAGYDLYYFDSEAVTPQHPKLWKYQPNQAEVREEILRYYDLVPLRTIQSDDYQVRRLFGRAACTLYRLQEWSVRTQILTRTPAVSTPAAVGLNLRGHPGGTMSFSCGENSWTQTLHAGMNVVRLPDREAVGQAPLILVSTSTLPADLEPVFVDAGQPLTVRLGRFSFPFDTAFFSQKESVIEPSRLGRHILAEAELRVPFVGGPSDALALDLALVVKRGCRQPGIRMECGGWSTNIQLQCDRVLQRVRVAIDARYIDGSEALVRLVNLEPVRADVEEKGIRVDGFRAGVAR